MKFRVMCTSSHFFMSVPGPFFELLLHIPEVRSSSTSTQPSRAQSTCFSACSARSKLRLIHSFGPISFPKKSRAVRLELYKVKLTPFCARRRLFGARTEGLRRIESKHHETGVERPLTAGLKPKPHSQPWSGCSSLSRTRHRRPQLSEHQVGGSGTGRVVSGCSSVTSVVQARSIRS